MKAMQLIGLSSLYLLIAVIAISRCQRWEEELRSRERKSPELPRPILMHQLP